LTADHLDAAKSALLKALDGLDIISQIGTLFWLIEIALKQKEYSEAYAYCQQMVNIYYTTGIKYDRESALFHIGEVLAAFDQVEHAVEIIACARAHWGDGEARFDWYAETHGTVPMYILRDQLGLETYLAAVERGRTTNPEDMIALLL